MKKVEKVQEILEGAGLGFKMVWKGVVFFNFLGVGEFPQGPDHKTSLQGPGMGEGDIFALVRLDSQKEEIDVDGSGAFGNIPFPPQLSLYCACDAKNFFGVEGRRGELENLIVKVGLLLVVHRF